MSIACLLLALLVCAGTASTKDGKEPPTPAERIASLKEDFAREHATLGSWADGKKLGKVAGAQYRLAVRLDPDCSRARQKLGHRKDGSGNWVAKKEKEWEWGKGAVEKHGEALAEKERELLAKEVCAFEKLGLTLLEEGEERLGRRLCLRAFLLDPKRVASAKALGLVQLVEGFVRPAVADAVKETPACQKGVMVGLLNQVLGIPTVVRQCSSSVVETVGSRDAADELAKVTHRAQVLSSAHLGYPPKTSAWIRFGVATGEEQFAQWLSSSGYYSEADAQVCLQVGSASGLSPHYCLSYGDPLSLRALFVHCAAEDLPILESLEECPSWLHEAAGVDAALVLLGVPGPLCVTVEQSQGLVEKDLLEKPAEWSRMLLRRSGMETLPRVEFLLRAQLQALGPEDVVAAHAFYRYALLEAPEALGQYLRNLGRRQPPDEAFEGAFGVGAPDATLAFEDLLCGG